MSFFSDSAMRREGGEDGVIVENTFSAMPRANTLCSSCIGKEVGCRYVSSIEPSRENGDSYTSKCQLHA